MADRLILASASPRRAELLTSMGLRFEVYAPDVDEDIPGDPREVTLTLARRKARAAAAHFQGDTILAADTLVSVDGEALAKPADEADARRMLSMLSGRWHSVFTGVCVLRGTYEQAEAAETLVRFSALAPKDVAAYIRSGEPFGKAGAYAIQGMAGMYVPEIRGSFTNVVGLPTSLVRTMLESAGYPLAGRE
ncbi:MAG TPA: Maf family protein [Candidatus Limnocylindria bacterium]|nr:Maf family protein [Candidatus Limnocylindria bacterium]